jgi:SAM-dependent methyltransferase
MDECPPYTEPELYDLLFPNAGGALSVGEERARRLAASERFYVEAAREAQGRVLELGCGSGRLTIPIALQGSEIVGVDLSRAMLDAARAKASAAGVEVQWLVGDMRRLDLPGQFSAIFIPGNSLLHLLTGEDLERCFACSRRHLFREGGWCSMYRTRRCGCGGVLPQNAPRYCSCPTPQGARSGSRKPRATMPGPRSSAWSGTFQSRMRRISGWLITHCAQSFRRNCRGCSKPPDSAWKSVTVDSRANLSSL